MNTTQETASEDHIVGYVIAFITISIFTIILISTWFAPLFRSCCRKKRETRALNKFITDECPMCLEQMKNEVEIRCGHSFCAKCMADYIRAHPSSVLTCPMCRSSFLSIFINYELDAEKPTSNDQTTIKEYNLLYGGEQKSFCNILRDFPMLMKVYAKHCCNRGMLCKSCCILTIIVLCAIYIISPYDLIPEKIFGIFGYIDDFSVLIYLLFIIGKIMIEVIFGEDRPNEPAEQNDDR